MTTSGRAAASSSQRARLRALAGQPEEVDAARVLDQLRRPVAADEDRVEPLQRGDRDRRRVAHREPHAVDPAGGVGDQFDARVLGVGGLRERAHVAQHLAERVRVQGDHPRRRVDPLRDRAHVVIGHGADRAERLRHDQVRRERLQRMLVELVDRAALLGELANRAIDLVRRQPGADQVAGDPGQRERLRRVVALVRHGRDLVAHAEREQHLGGRRDERDDAHTTSMAAAGGAVGHSAGSAAPQLATLAASP